MSAVMLAWLERPRKLGLWAWAHTNRENSTGDLDVHVLGADGRPGGGVQRARAQRTDAPVGAAAWLASSDNPAMTPCVVLGVTEDGIRLRVRTPRGEVESAPEWVWPVPSPGARPHASGAAIITARTGLARTEVDRRRFALRWEILWLRGVHDRDGLAGATWIDVALLSHQLAAAREVLGAPWVRHVLADEVGLGKTIEALMIWSALSAHERSLKCFVAAPRSLVFQWLIEVRRRAEHRLRARGHEDFAPVYDPNPSADLTDKDNPRGLMIAEHDALPELARRADIKRASELRDALLTAAVVLIKEGLMPALQVNDIVNRRGTWGVAQDCIDLAELFREHHAAIKGRTAITKEQVDEAARVLAIDMLIVDEGHTLNGDQRRAVEVIARSARHLLLLTATPREGKRGGGAAREFRRGFAWAAGLVDPKWPPPDLEDGDLERALERTVDESLARARACDQVLARREPDAAPLDGDPVGELAGIPIPSRARRDVRTFLQASTLLERVVRTRRSSIGPGLTATRRLIRVPIEYRAEEVAVLDAVREMDDPAERAAVVKQACSSWDALAQMRGGKTTSLRARLDVIRGGPAAWRPDAKAEALLDLCARIWDEDPAAKLVIRCEYAETRSLVVGHLKGLLLSGGLRRSTPGEIEAWKREEQDTIGPVARLEQGQDAMLDALRNPTAAGRSMLAHLWAFERYDEGSAVALVASDVASTGLNLQFASALILYDVPWTPGAAEQWIGRLDRLGQRAGEVRVYAMSHRALLTERLVDAYESIGLFDQRGFHVSPAVELRINDLLRPTDSDESSWDEAVAAVQREIDADEDDPTRGASLDLSLEPTPSQEGSQRSIRRFVEATAVAGFTFDMRRDGSMKMEWPLSDADALWLPGAAAALRPPEAVGRMTPEKLAELREQSRPLNITGKRLGEGRWLREWNVDMFSPRHPLFVEIEDDLLRDPSLALGGFRCASAGVGAPPGVYLLAQSQTSPAVGGDAMAWRCHVPDSVLQDEELSRFWATIEEAMRRMMRVRCRAELSRGAWLLASSGGAALPQPPERVDVLLMALPAAQSRPVSEISPNVEAALVAMERPPAVLPPDILTVVTNVADDVSREAGLRLGQVIARRRSAVESIGEGDAWRGLRDARLRALQAAQALRGALEDLPSHARWGAIEAATPRVVAAAVIEVRP